MTVTAARAARTARRTAPAALSPVDPSTVAAPLAVVPQDSAPPEIRRLLEQYRDRAHRAKVSRRSLQTGRLEYLGTLEVAALDEENVRQTWGGGAFRVALHDGAGDYVGHISFDIAGPHKVPQLEPGSHAPASDLEQVRGELRELRDTLRELRTAPAAPARDPFDMAVRLAELMRPAAGASPAAAGDVLETLARGIAIGKQIAGAPAGEVDGFGQLASSLGVPLLQLLQRDVQAKERIADRATRAPRANPPAAPASLPPHAAAGAAATTAPAPAPVAVPADPNAPAWVARVANYVPILAQMARRGLSVNDVACMILAQVEDDTFAELRAAAAGASFVDDSAAALGRFPQLEAHGPYLRALLAELREQLEGEAGDAGGDGADCDE